MIKNEREYKITRAQAGKLETALAEALALPRANSNREARLQQLREDSIRAQLAGLQAQVREYEALRDGAMVEITAASLVELPRTLIQARLARRFSQKQLAERLGLKEQQIQRYEASDYESASLARLIEVANALGVTVYLQLKVPALEGGDSSGTLRAPMGVPLD
jgi:ribosome-binding protein aMBF1 (putative translation factor)